MAYASYPMPEDLPDYPNHFQIAQYFDDYVDHFGFRDRIRFRTEVTHVEPKDGGWAVSWRDLDTGEDGIERLQLRDRRQRPPLESALARARVRGPGLIRGRADPRPLLQGAGHDARQARHGARDRQLGDRPGGRGLAKRRPDLPRDAPRGVDRAEVRGLQAHRRAGAGRSSAACRSRCSASSSAGR